MPEQPCLPTARPIRPRPPTPDRTFIRARNPTGSLSLDVGNLHRGSASSRSCSLRLLDPQAPRLNLFRAQRTRAWWPLGVNAASGRYALAVSA